MLKLARNALADLGEIQYNLTIIKWDYIVQLNKLQNNLTFKLKNKLNSQCILWRQNKMKVKYAANTLSSSVANAIDFLRNEGFDEFKNSESTTQFIKVIDRLFDFLNSRNPFSKNYKQPITINNFHFLQNMWCKKISNIYFH